MEIAHKNLSKMKKKNRKRNNAQYHSHRARWFLYHHLFAISLISPSVTRQCIKAYVNCIHGYRTEWKLLPISRRYSAFDLRSRNMKRLLGGFIHETPGNDTDDKSGTVRSKLKQRHCYRLYRAKPLDPELFKRMATLSVSFCVN